MREKCIGENRPAWSSSVQLKFCRLQVKLYNNSARRLPFCERKLNEIRFSDYLLHRVQVVIRRQWALSENRLNPNVLFPKNACAKILQSFYHHNYSPHNICKFLYCIFHQSASVAGRYRAKVGLSQKELSHLGRYVPFSAFRSAD